MCIYLFIHLFFQPIAAESLDPVNTVAYSFLAEMRWKILGDSGATARVKFFMILWVLYEQLSVAADILWNNTALL